MCATCGCSSDADVSITELHGDHHHHHGGDDHHHHHDDHHHDHHHHHDHGGGHHHHHHHPAVQARTPRMVELEHQVLSKNNELAERNRQLFGGQAILALNLIGGPGAGKTTLLEETLRALGSQTPVSIIEGDQATLLDAERIRAAGGPVVQVNTGNGCHLDAGMVADSVGALRPQRGSLLIIENVGNLVCPALFDLGEREKVVLLSVTEGEDKPLKYPHIFRASTLMLLNKVDLLPYVRFDVDKCIAYARQVNPNLEVIQLSATRGDGMDAWMAWLRARLGATEASAAARQGQSSSAQTR